VQPPPGPLKRAEWQHAMCDVACNVFKVQWTEIVPDATLSALAEKLTLEKYSQRSYNTKR